MGRSGAKASGHLSAVESQEEKHLMPKEEKKHRSKIIQHHRCSVVC